jgi:hypothetical protein
MTEPRKVLGQLCPCGMEPATVELRVGPVYTKIGARCFNSGVHFARLLSRLLTE